MTKKEMLAALQRRLDFLDAKIYAVGAMSDKARQFAIVEANALRKALDILVPIVELRLEHEAACLAARRATKNARRIANGLEPLPEVPDARS